VGRLGQQQLEAKLGAHRENIVNTPLPFRELPVRSTCPPQGRPLSTYYALRLLGAPALVTPEGTPAAPLLGAKPMALLAFMALERRVHTRESLAGLLWGDSPEAEARGSLRQALKQLREALGAGLRTERTRIELTVPLACDVLEFREAAEREPARAAGFEVPRFLEGFSVRRAPLFDEWVAATQAVLLREYHQVLGRLGREAVSQWRWRDAVELADRWLATDPVSDEAAHLAIEARYLSGNRAAALARFGEYRALLAREAGCEPSRALQALVRRVEADRNGAEARPMTDEWYVHAPSFEASLVGREAPWKQLTAAWKRTARGRSGIVLLEGESGVGKSRLADEFLRWSVAEGATVLRGQSHEGSLGIPYEPVVEVLRGALDAPGVAGTAAEWLVEVGRLVPELRERFPGLPGGAAPDPADGWRLFEGVAQLLAAVAAERPLVVLIDDLQWCDEDSCNLLRFLIRRLERSPVLWLGLLTLGEVERDAPAARLCRVLRAKSHAEVVAIGPLSEEEVWQMVRDMGHVSVPSGGRRFAGRLFRITAGNPFYIIELLKTMFAQGLLVMEEKTGEWTVSAEAVGAGCELHVSQTVQDAISERVERLPDELRDVLITLAVSGVGCRPDVLSHVHGISRLHAASDGDALVHRRLAIEEAGTYRCAHPVIAHMVRDGLTASRRQEVHRSLALALGLVLRPEEASAAASELARHADRGSEPGLAYRYALLAAEGAVSRYAYTEALSWLDLAASSAREAAESELVDRRTADVLEQAGWREAPGGQAQPVTREIVTEDLDLRVRG
jgi:DNA-binding SARP family transcriptional activator